MSTKNLEENLASFVDVFFQDAHKYSEGILGSEKFTKLIKEDEHKGN